MIIKTDSLRKVYRTEEIETVAISNVSMEVKEGEFIAVMGPSGCGKSTLLNLLGLLDKPNSGEYHFMGYPTSHLPERERIRLRKGNIGFVFQSFNLIDELTVYENVELPLLYTRVPSKERRDRVLETLQRFELLHRKNHFPHQLSGGQQQRAAVARAVIAKPKLVLADEPTGNLDSIQSQEVMYILTKLNEEGTTIVVVTHSSEQAEYAGRIIHLFDGHIVTESVKRAVNA